MQINQLPRADAVESGDLVVIFSQSNCDARALPMTVLLEYLQSNMTGNGSFMTQYFAPNTTGFSVTINPATNGQNVYLEMTPTGTLAAGTIILPSTPVDMQEVLVTSTQIVTALTVNGNGKTVNGAPTTIAANGFFRLRYDGVNQSWYRVG